MQNDELELELEFDEAALLFGEEGEGKFLDSDSESEPEVEVEVEKKKERKKPLSSSDIFPIRIPAPTRAELLDAERTKSNAKADARIQEEQYAAKNWRDKLGDEFLGTSAGITPHPKRTTPLYKTTHTTEAYQAFIARQRAAAKGKGAGVGTPPQ